MFEQIRGVLALLASAIGLVTALITVWVLWNKSKREVKQLLSENNELKKKYSSSSFVIDLFQLNAIREIVDNIFNTTQIDRFLILSAMNGKDDFAFVSALYEQHEFTPQGKLSMGATSKYIDLRTDDNYRKMIKYIETIEPFLATTENMPEGMLKEIYLSEKIKATMVVFSHRQRLDAHNDRVFYVSWSSHENKMFNYSTQAKVKGATKRITDRLKG